MIIGEQFVFVEVSRWERSVLALSYSPTGPRVGYSIKLKKSKFRHSTFTYLFGDKVAKECLDTMFFFSI